jgi:hypothetical protein
MTGFLILRRRLLAATVDSWFETRDDALLTMRKLAGDY